MMKQRLGTGSRTPAPIPAEIDSPMAKLVYLYVDVAGPAPVAELNKMLAMKKISILSVLNSLDGRELVERADEGYVTTV